jgi:hypothetical protein
MIAKKTGGAYTQYKQRFLQLSLILLDYAVALFFPSVPKLVIVIYRLKNRRVSQLPLQPAFTNSEYLFVFEVSADFEQFFAAFGAIVGTVDHLFGVFGEQFHTATGNLLFSLGLVGTHSNRLESSW